MLGPDIPELDPSWHAIKSQRELESRSRELGGWFLLLRRSHELPPPSRMIHVSAKAEDIGELREQLHGDCLISSWEDDIDWTLSVAVETGILTRL